MNPFYSVEELSELLDRGENEIADGLKACGVPMIYSGCEADLSQWFATSVRQDDNGTIVAVRNSRRQPPSDSVMVDTDKLPAAWKAAISQSEAQANASIPSDAHEVDWVFWSNRGTTSVVEAVWLSFGYDPRAMRYVNMDDDMPAAAQRREIVLTNMMNGKLSRHVSASDRYHDRSEGSNVSLVEFRVWGESLPEPFSFPEQFPGTPRASRARAEPSKEELARWAREDLWSHAELSDLCAGLLPSAANRSNDELSTVNEASEAIARGTHSGTLAFVPRDDVDTAARMYGTARHYVPAIAAEWAATRFKDTFPASLLAAVREHAQSVPAAPVTRWPWGDHETKLLRKLAAAADKFWKLYDPEDESTAPTNDAVVAWLKTQGVESDRITQAMATILRADGLRTGPRK